MAAAAPSEKQGATVDERTGAAEGNETGAALDASVHHKNQTKYYIHMCCCERSKICFNCATWLESAI